MSELCNSKHLGWGEGQETIKSCMTAFCSGIFSTEPSPRQHARTLMKAGRLPCILHRKNRSETRRKDKAGFVLLGVLCSNTFKNCVGTTPPVATLYWKGKPFMESLGTLLMSQVTEPQAPRSFSKAQNLNSEFPSSSAIISQFQLPVQQFFCN